MRSDDQLNRTPASYNKTMLFVTSPPRILASQHGRSLSCKLSRRPATFNSQRVHKSSRMALSDEDEKTDNPSAEDFSVEKELAKIESMRERLEGLFGQYKADTDNITKDNFDGTALRKAIINRWGVQYDIQPVKFHNRVYVQIMWRYFEQQSFYMDEDEYTSHCEAIAILLKRWDAVEYFIDYITNIKKRPVVGITINIPIPGIEASETAFEV